MRLVDLDEIEYFTLVDKDGMPRFKIEIGEGLPIVKAIPIEWLKSWAMKNWVKSKKCEFDIIVSKLIDDWLEEVNGRSV